MLTSIDHLNSKHDTIKLWNEKNLGTTFQQFDINQYHENIVNAYENM